MRAASGLRIASPTRNGDSGGSRSAARSAPLAATKVIASIAANVTLLTALLFWFGLLYTQVFFEYFRVHPTVLDQPAQDILARGVDGLFVPLAVLAAGALVGLCAVRYLRSRLSTRRWLLVLRVCAPIAAVAGLALVTLAVIAIAHPDGPHGYPGLAGSGLAVGVLLLLFAWHHVATAGVVEWSVALLLVVIGLFWAVSDYSQAVGAQRAWESEQRIPELSDLLLYSGKSLNLTADGVHQVVCSDADADYRYRYDGLKLLLESGGQYILLPAGWTHSNGTTIVLPRTDSLRLEFLPAGTRVQPCRP
jgi:hypothetical protein